MTIANLHFNNLRNEEHFQFQTDFKWLVEQYTPAALKIETEFAAYIPLHSSESEALDFLRKSYLTAEIVEAKRARNKTFRGLSNMVKGALNHFHPEVKEAAARLRIVLKHVGNIATKNNSAATTAITVLVTNFQNDTYAPDVATVNIADWVAQLQADNEAFVALAASRANQNAAKTKLRMKQVRVHVDASYKVIVTRINALAVVEGADGYANFIRKLNVRVAAQKLEVAKRKGRREKVAKKEEGESNGISG